MDRQWLHTPDDGIRMCRENMENVASGEHGDSLVLLECAHCDVGMVFEDCPSTGAIDTV